MQLRAQLRRTPCQMYRVTSASESSGGRLPRAEVAYLYGSEKIKFFLHDVIEPLRDNAAAVPSRRPWFRPWRAPRARDLLYW